MKRVIIIGTGGHSKVVTNIIELSGDCVVGYLTSDVSKLSFLGKPVLGSDSDYAKWPDCYFIIAIGDQYVRERIASNMVNVKWYTAVHPSAILPKQNFTIGEGSVISANAVINPCATIGRHCIINTNAVVEHDNYIADFVHISVGVHLAGNVKIGARTWVGIGACVINDICICGDCLIGAGAVVVNDIVEKETYIGVPAQKMHKRHPNRS